MEVKSDWAMRPGKCCCGNMTSWARSVANPPRLHMPLQCAQLPFLVAPRKRGAQQREQRLRLQRRIVADLGLDPRPVAREWIVPRPMRARLLHLARQLPRLLVLACGALAHARPRRRQLLTRSLATFIQQQFDFSVFLHASSQGSGMITRRRGDHLRPSQPANLIVATGKCNCRWTEQLRSRAYLRELFPEDDRNDPPQDKAAQALLDEMTPAVGVALGAGVFGNQAKNTIQVFIGADTDVTCGLQVSSAGPDRM